jgi:EAL domain-containing protein (putative c-di-GMP-specific phosphodiesterase class I)
LFAACCNRRRDFRISTMTAAVRACLDSIARDPRREDLRVTDSGHVVGRFLRCEVGSAYQAVYRSATDPAVAEPTAYQALARVHGEGRAELAPWNLFALAASDEELVVLDRRCRVVHTLNFFSAQRDAVLLLNVHERLLEAVEVDHGHAFQRVLASLGIAQRQVAIVLPLLTEATLDRQAQVIANYRLNGFRVAVTADQAALLQTLLGRIAIDIARSEVRHLGQAAWRSLVPTLRAAGAEVHATRIEDAAQLGHARTAGATHLQGRLLSPPSSAVRDLDAALVGG